MYRQDFAGGPPPDTEDRQGINENKYGSGMIAFWDGLLRRKPGLMIDMCSGGGRRNDLEAMRRSIPLWYSDNVGDLVGIQSRTYGVAFWLPTFGTCIPPNFPYEFRGRMTPCMTLDIDIKKNNDYETTRKLIGQWRRIAPCYHGDYWPLTRYSRATGDWLVWQYDRPDLGEGFVQAAVRPDANFDLGRFRLFGLDARATYLVSDIDAPEKETKISGKELLAQGLTIKVEKKPAAPILVYKKGNQ